MDVDLLQRKAATARNGVNNTVKRTAYSLRR